MCKRIGQKISADNIKVMVLDGEDGFECEVPLDGRPLEQVLEFKYLVCFE